MLLGMPRTTSRGWMPQISLLPIPQLSLVLTPQLSLLLTPQLRSARPQLLQVSHKLPLAPGAATMSWRCRPGSQRP